MILVHIGRWVLNSLFATWCQKYFQARKQTFDSLTQTRNQTSDNLDLPSQDKENVDDEVPFLYSFGVVK
jgi:hypothetical protein